MYQHSDCAEKARQIPSRAPENGSGATPRREPLPKQILIVDDERPIRMLLQKILEANGYACRIAEMPPRRGR